MQLEFTYDAADFRELQIPEAYAANPAKYRRRWIWPALWFTFSATMLWLYFWIQRRLPNPASPTVAAPDYEPRTELLPALIPAFYVCAIYVLTLIKAWRAARDPDAATRAPHAGAGRVATNLLGAVVGVAVWFGIAGAWEWDWQPSRTQIVLVTAAPWILLIVLMQVLGAFQRRGKAVTPWRTNPAWRRPKTATLDESGFRIRDQFYRFECEWTYIKRVRETLNLLVLIAEGGSQYLIPKRAFADAADLERCRSLLQNVVRNTRFLVRPIGFAVLPKPVLPLPEIEAEPSTRPSLTRSDEPGTMRSANELEPQQ